mmetsp:Transcript_27551/g.92698  ORF Transcript_27551/g.92698 Transcript_27551/m.92698 type:complete len:224 (+) Transcript_27551:578-1249(+)
MAAEDLHMRNLEALAPPSAGGGDDTDPFASCYAFRHTPRDYCAYINGKSFGAVGVAGLAPAGPHHFCGGVGGGDSVPVPPRVAVVLHYECCSFPRWRRKYAQLAASHSPADTDAVPFEFYRASIRLAAALVAAQDANAEEAAVVEALAHWRQWKLPPPEAEVRARELRCGGGGGGEGGGGLGTGGRPCCALACGVSLLWPLAPHCLSVGQRLRLGLGVGRRVV